jgi:hypothetical protein
LTAAPSFDPVIAAFYARGGELARLATGVFRIERARTEEEASIVGLSAHLLAVGTRPQGNL